METLKRVTSVVSILSLVAACNTDTGPDAGVQDPQNFNTRDGAILMSNSATAAFRAAMFQTAIVGGLITDELYSRNIGLSSIPGTIPSYLDTRILGEEKSGGGSRQNEYRGIYDGLNSVRAKTNQATGALLLYAPNEPTDRRAENFAQRGYAELLLADLFCSGIPLSTFDFEKDFTYQPGSSTEAVYTSALAAFDSAGQLAGTNAIVRQFAAVGRGRTLLALRRYREARDAVADVVDTFSYQFVYQFTLGTGSGEFGGASVSDREGMNGLPYRSATDPRVKIRHLGSVPRGVEVYIPEKYYSSTGYSPFVVANGVEARLIEAEAQLADGDAVWLTTLNALRTNGSFTERPNANDPNVIDTIWNAGKGGVAGLRPLTDPGTDQARVDLLFYERAFWLFMTGHRQGDARRLIRQYGRSSETVYPVGTYLDRMTLYGADITIPVPQEEHELNPRYHGCIDRGA